MFCTRSASLAALASFSCLATGSSLAIVSYITPPTGDVTAGAKTGGCAAGTSRTPPVAFIFSWRAA